VVVKGVAVVLDEAEWCPAQEVKRLTVACRRCCRRRKTLFGREGLTFWLWVVRRSSTLGRWPCLR
jgi:hypothetical protein